MTHYTWTVIGAGPAGIASVGRLLDHGVRPNEIAWIDPQFAAGDLGEKWGAVPSNTQVSLFLDYFNASPAFGFAAAPHFDLHDIDPQHTCQLGVVAGPLRWVTEHLRAKVAAFQSTATELSLRNQHWQITTLDGEISSKNVILAVGSTPKKLTYPELKEIPVEVALNPEKLAQQQLDGATVAVFGSSHSTMIALPNLLEHPVHKVINFYRSPHRYAVPFQDWTLFDDTGLKGDAARWARENIDGRHPERLHRCLVDSPEFARLLRECDQAVYTVGFERRHLPLTPQWGPLEHDGANGILAPGLFGIGIAFPEYRTDPLGFGEHRVGMAKFMQRLNSVLPLWLQYGGSRRRLFARTASGCSRAQPPREPAHTANSSWGQPAARPSPAPHPDAAMTTGRGAGRQHRRTPDVAAGGARAQPQRSASGGWQRRCRAATGQRGGT